MSFLDVTKGVSEIVFIYTQSWDISILWMKNDCRIKTQNRYFLISKFILRMCCTWYPREKIQKLAKHRKLNAPLNVHHLVKDSQNYSCNQISKNLNNFSLFLPSYEWFTCASSHIVIQREIPIWSLYDNKMEVSSK